MFKRIDHVAINVSDIDRSIDFYQTHFGFKCYFEHKVSSTIRIAYLKLGDTVLELVGHYKNSTDSFHFALETVDFNLAIQNLLSGGVKIKREPHDTPPRHPGEKGWLRAEFFGPDNEIIEIRGPGG